MLLLLQGLPSRGEAHPFGERYAALRLEVEVAEDAVDIVLTADVPDKLLRAMVPDADDPVRRALTRLDHGVTLTIDGKVVPLRRVEESSRLDLVDGTAWVLTARWTAAADLAGRHTLRVGNANFGEAPAWFLDAVSLPAGTTVHETNLVRHRRGREEPLHDAWLRHEGLRRVDLDFELPDGAWPGVFRSRTPRWDLARARAPGGFSAWRSGRDDPFTIPLATTVGLLGGAGAGLVAGPGLSTRAIALLIASAMAAAKVGAAGLLGALVGAALLVALLDARLARLAPLLMAPWVASATSPSWISAPTLGFALGLLAGIRTRRHAGGVALLAVAAMMAAARGGPLP